EHATDGLDEDFEKLLAIRRTVDRERPTEEEQPDGTDRERDDHEDDLRGNLLTVHGGGPVRAEETVDRLHDRALERHRRGSDHIVDPRYDPRRLAVLAAALGCVCRALLKHEQEIHDLAILFFFIVAVSKRVRDLVDGLEPDRHRGS